jgi:hypothetical protein
MLHLLSGLGDYHAKDGDGARFRTAVEANAASRTAIAPVLRGVHAVLIQFRFKAQHLGRTGLDTEAAALALVVVDFDISS